MSSAGIDLGTTNSCISVPDPTGNPVILPNEKGELLTPSAVCFLNGEVLVGQEAKNAGLLHPECYAVNWKRKMGTDEVLLELEDGSEIRALDCAVPVLKSLASDFERDRGEPLLEAAISVPSGASDPQKEQTRLAGERAGFKVTITPHEPSCGALASHLFERCPSGGKVLIPDWGGGTCDVSVVEVSHGLVEVLVSVGESSLGGCDLDSRLANSLLEKFERKHKFRPNIGEHLTAMQQFLPQVEQAKISLSTRESTQFLFAVDGKSFEHTLTRDELRGLGGDLFERAVDLAERALHDAKVRPEDLVEIIPVGGSSKSPIFLELLKERLGRAASFHTDPLFAVGLGAFSAVRIQAEREGRKSTSRGRVLPPVRVEFQERTTHALGVCVVDKGGEFWNSAILESGQPIPASYSQDYFLAQPGQTSALIRVLQGPDGARAAECVELGTFELNDLDPIYDEPHRIRIRLRLNASGVLKAEAIDDLSGVRQDMEISYSIGAPTEAA